MLTRVQDLAEALRPAMAPGSAAAAGAELLTRLLARVWYAPGAAAEGPGNDGAADGGANGANAGSGPLYLPELEATLGRGRAASDAAVQFLRLAASLELRRGAARYAPFAAGCGPAYAAAPIAEVCARHVEPMGVPVEQLQVAALAAALGAPVGVVGAAGHGGGESVGVVEHGAGEGLDGAEAAALHVIHLPGHYDIVYRRGGGGGGAADGGA